MDCILSERTNQMQGGHQGDQQIFGQCGPHTDLPFLLMQEVHQGNRTEITNCPMSRKNIHQQPNNTNNTKLSTVLRIPTRTTASTSLYLMKVVCTSQRANLLDTWGITSWSGSLDFHKGEPKLLGPEPERRIGDLGDRGEFLGESGGVHPSLKTPGSSEAETLGLVWAVDEFTNFASSSKDIT